MENQVQVKEVVMFPDGRLDVKNAASYLGFAEKTLAMMRCEGTGPKFIKRGEYSISVTTWMSGFVPGGSAARHRQQESSLSLEPWRIVI